MLFLAMFYFFSSTKFSEQINLDFKFALSYFNKIDRQASVISKKYELKKSDILPVVYPECARFNNFSNVLEKSILQYYYVENGSESSDFSIGYFQMKPSFVEKLEKYIEKDSIFRNLKQKFEYQSSSGKSQREERLDRLMNENWQLEYLCAFVKLMKHRYLQEEISSNELSFVAAAYNYGFFKKTDEILKWQEMKAFPNGIKNQAQNYSYSELAVDCKTKYFSYEN